MMASIKIAMAPTIFDADPELAFTDLYGGNDCDDPEIKHRWCHKGNLV